MFTKDNFAQNLRILIRMNGLSQAELAEATGVSSQTISNYVNARYSPNSENLRVLANFFHVTPEELFFGNCSIEPINPDGFESLSNYSEYYFIPNGISAGMPLTIEGMEELPKIIFPDVLLGKYSKGKNIVFMRINGESMNKVIPNGSIVGVYMRYPLENLRDGDIVVFSYDNEYSVKRFYQHRDKIIFRPDSADVSFTDLVIPKDEKLNIIGKVVTLNIFV